jgi:hypothetical protein
MLHPDGDGALEHSLGWPAADFERRAMAAIEY